MIPLLFLIIGRRRNKKGWAAEEHPFIWRRHPDLNRGIAVLQGDFRKA
jgi:hypothetical protein